MSPGQSGQLSTKISKHISATRAWLRRADGMEDKPSSIPQQLQQVDRQTAAIVDPQVLASLLYVPSRKRRRHALLMIQWNRPSFVELYEAAASGSASQLDIAKQVSGGTRCVVNGVD